MIEASFDWKPQPKLKVSVPDFGSMSRSDVRRARREAKREAKREVRRVIEHEFDFSDASVAIQHAGNAVRSAIEGIGEAFDSNAFDPDLVPMDDERAIRRRVEAQFSKRKEFFGHLTSYLVVNIAFWAIFYITGFLAPFPWPLIVSLAWGSGLVAHAVETYYATGRRATKRLRIIQDEFYSVYGPDWQRADRKELRRIRDRVVQPMTKRREFADHLAVYVTINTMLWVIYISTGFLAPLAWPLIVMLGWGIGLVAHGTEVVTTASRENAIERAIERERDQLYESEKPKHEERLDDSYDVRLTEDGEFTESMVEEIDAEEKQKRDRR